LGHLKKLLRIIKLTKMQRNANGFGIVVRQMKAPIVCAASHQPLCQAQRANGGRILCLHHLWHIFILVSSDKIIGLK
jgi:hypothetical protein